jgi:hypothetical protein
MDDFIIYFAENALGSYILEPEKYTVVTNGYEGSISITESFYSDIEKQNDFKSSINLRFGYRKLNNGGKAIVVMRHHFSQLSDLQKQRFLGFHLNQASFLDDDDVFDTWVKRYIEGSWDIENGGLSQVEELMKLINAVTKTSVDEDFYAEIFHDEVRYPIGENTHAYEDAHGELYRYLIDSINKDCIVALAKYLKAGGNYESDNTINAIKKLFPKLDGRLFDQAMGTVSRNRRPSAHKPRPKAEKYPAHSQFESDLSICAEGLKELQATLSTATGLDPEKCFAHLQQKKYFPKMVKSQMNDVTAKRIQKMVGKTIASIEFGYRNKIEGVHGSDLVICHFTDGSSAAIDTGSNAGHFEDRGVRADEFHADFMIAWIDPIK